MPEHIIVIHRWNDNYSDYGSYLNHQSCRVTYITTDLATTSLPDEAAAVRIVRSTEDGEQVRSAAESLIQEFGLPIRIIALHETDLDIAAELRKELGVLGDRPEELAPFRDKLEMANRLTAAGVPTPATEEVIDHASVRDFAAVYGWPLLIKPARGTASAGVTRLDTDADLDQYVFEPGTRMLIQPFLPHEIIHVDGVATQRGLGVWRASRYLNTCLEFTGGSVLGSLELDDPQLVAAIGEFTGKVTRAMSANSWVFHLELFLSGPPDAPVLQVLEVGARPGGAEIPFLWREVHGVDLMAIACALQMGELLPDTAYASTGAEPREYGGWLLIPTPIRRPCHVVAAAPQVGRSGGPYAERIPRVGQRLDDLPGYEHSGARFRFRASSTACLEKSVHQTIAEFDFRCASTDPVAV